MVEIHQFVPNFYQGDAISGQLLELDKIFHRLGFSGKIWTVSSDRFLKKLARPYQQYSRFSRKDDLIFYHLSDPSPMTVFFHNLPGRKIIIYHNVTPHHFFRESRLFYPTQDPQEIQALAEVVEFAFGVSEFNRAELA